MHPGPPRGCWAPVARKQIRPAFRVERQAIVERTRDDESAQRAYARPRSIRSSGPGTTMVCASHVVWVLSPRMLGVQIAFDGHRFVGE